MPSSSRSFSQIIQHRQITGFVGREAQLALFRDNLSVPPDDNARRFLFSIHGDGGVGKSSLLGRMRQVAAEAGRLTAVADESVFDLPDALAELARQLEGQGGRFKRFGQRYAAYNKRASGDTEPSGGERAASAVTRGTVRMGLGAVRSVPAGGILAEAVNPDDAAQRIDDLRAGAARKWRNRDGGLDATPVEGLARQFVEGLRKLDRPIALFLDTYERTAPFLDAWLRGLFDGAWGEPPTDIVVTVAGRYPLDPNRWSAYLGVQVDMPLAPFTATEARQLLAQRDITDEQVIEAILAASDGLPLSIAMLAANRPADPAAVRDVTGSVVERFLQWAPDDGYREIALAAALPRHVDQDVLGVLGAAEAYGWLSAQPFVAQTAGRCHYHDIVRGPMVRLYRTRSARDWRDGHAKLAAAYRGWRTELTGDTPAARERLLWQRSDWQEKLVEETYHDLCADPVGALPGVLGRAVQACRHSPPTARRLAETIVQAGRDAGAAGLRSLGDELAAALPDADGEWIGYLDVILAHPAATGAVRANAYRERGRRHRLAARYEQALADFDRALERDPDYADALVGRGKTYQEMGRQEDALADFDRAIRLDPDDEATIADRGESYRLLGRYEEALADFGRAVRLDPEYVWAIGSRGETYRDMGRYDEALADFDRALDIDPGRAWVVGDRGDTYRLMRRYDEALADFDRALEIEPRDAWTWGGRGETYMDMGRHEEALAAFDRAIELNPGYAWAVANRAHTCYLLDRYDDAVAGFDRAIELDPGFESALTRRGIVLSTAGRHDRALADFDRAIELNPDSAAAIGGRADVLRATRRYDEAIAGFGRALELDPGYVWALAARARTYLAMNRHAEAVADLSRAVELDPAYDWAFTLRGNAYRGMRRYDEAIADYDRAVAIDPGNDLAIAGRAEAYRLTGRYDEAIAGFDRAIEIDPEYDWAIASRGQTYRVLGRYEEARADFDRALELDPRYDWAMAERAAVLRRLGRYDEARADLDRAIAIDPDDVDYLLERALTSGPATGDRYQFLVDRDATAAEAPALAEAIREWLVADGIAAEAVTACAPGGGHAPGPARDTAVTGPFGPDVLDRRFHGVAVHAEPQVAPALPTAAATCPSCGARAEMRAAFAEDVVDALDAGPDAGGLRCPGCTAVSAVRHWIFDPAWAFGELTVAFWNWPPLAPEFADAVARRLGHRVALVTGVV